MPHSTTTLSTDTVEDLIYFSRAGDLESLKESIESLTNSQSCTAYEILTSAIDVDEEGLGSGSCLLHYPSANGNLEIVTYLLSLMTTSQTTSSVEPVEDGELITTSKLVNHQNVSGNTPLHWAGMNGHLEIVKALVKAGADPEIVNAAGRDAVVESEWSAKDGAADCAVWILSECGALEKGVGEGVEEGGSSDRLDDTDVVEDVANEEVNGSGSGKQPDT